MALRRFGAPFRSPLGEVSPLGSELPILRYIFVHHVREFPFLDKTKEKEFWQDKLQVVGSPSPCYGLEEEEEGEVRRGGRGDGGADGRYLRRLYSS